MTEKAWIALNLTLMGGGLTSVYLSTYNLSGNAAIPNRIKSAISYWGATLFFGGFGLFGLPWLAVELVGL
ncbi:MAG: hypothetical protein V4659_12275 [Pseudomonadota bacterium]